MGLKIFHSRTLRCLLVSIGLICVSNLIALPGAGRSLLLETIDHDKPAIYAQSNISNDDESSTHRPPNGTLKYASAENLTCIAIFYNIYVPLQNQTQENPIIEEQIQQIGQRFQDSPSAVILNYVSIGNPIDHLVQDTCFKYDLICQRKAHRVEGFEEEALNELWDYCQLHPTSSVAYIHNKGSFHPKPELGEMIDQGAWRRAGTRAALSQDCAQGLADRGCDFCGLVVTPIPWLHAPGNFWTAKCSYINQLLQPKKYRNAFDSYVVDIAGPSLENQTMNLVYRRNGRDFKGTPGQGRQTSEGWIGSHPLVTPCDVSSVSDILHWQTEDRYDEFNLSLAPRRELLHMMEVARTTPIPPYVLHRTHLRIRDYHFLGGIITKWLYFYNQLPPPSSWYWSHFPDAGHWQEAVALFGALAFEKMAASVPPIGKKARKA